MKKLFLFVLVCFPSILFSQQKLFATKDVLARRNPEPISDVIFTIISGDSITPIGYRDGYYIVSRQEQRGYANEIFFKHNFTSDFFDSLKIKGEEDKKADELLKNKMREDRDRQLEIGVNNKLETLYKEYGKDNVQKALNKQLWIGMARGLVLISQGFPKNKTKSTDKNGIIEIWEYENKTIYINNKNVFKYTEY